MNALQQKIKLIQNTRAIRDPFPELTFEAYYSSDSLLGMLLRIIGYVREPMISAHAAYRKGYDQAYAEIMNELENEV